MTKKTNNLKLSGYISIACFIFVLLTGEFLASLPFLINAWVVAKYTINKKFEVEAIIALSLIMVVLNIFVASLIDTVVWLYFTYSWYKK